MSWRALLDRASAGEVPSRGEVFALLDCDDLDTLMTAAAALRDEAHGANVSYSRKVFIPLTQLCRDSCYYCTFAHPPRRGSAAYLTPHINCPERNGGDVEATQPIDRLKTKVLECSTAMEQALHVTIWEADGDELEVLQSW
jgi:hypothetical protein